MKNRFYKIYLAILCYYFLAYLLGILLSWLVISLEKYTGWRLLSLYLVIVYVMIPVAILVVSAFWYKTYTLTGLLNVFFSSFLLAIPSVHLALFGHNTIDWGSTLLGQNFFHYLTVAVALSTLAGLLGLLLNSIYILIFRLLKKA
jgi:hypothetical protein